MRTDEYASSIRLFSRRGAVRVYKRAQSTLARLAINTLSHAVAFLPANPYTARRENP